MLYLVTPAQKDDAEEINNEILAKFPDNIGALYNKIQILKFSEDLDDAWDILEEMQRIVGTSKESSSEGRDEHLQKYQCMLKADEAFFLIHVSPKYYGRAIHLLSEVIDFFKYHHDDTEAGMYIRAYE